MIDVHGDEHLTFSPNGYDFCDGDACIESDNLVHLNEDLTSRGGYKYCAECYPKCECGRDQWEHGDGGCLTCELELAIKCLQDDPGDEYSQQIVRLAGKDKL